MSSHPAVFPSSRLCCRTYVGATEWYVDDSPHLAEGRLDDLCEQARLVKTVKGLTPIAKWDQAETVGFLPG